MYLLEDFFCFEEEGGKRGREEREGGSRDCEREKEEEK